MKTLLGIGLGVALIWATQASALPVSRSEASSPSISTGHAEPAMADLTSTVVGALVPGETGRLAVRWTSNSTVELEGWVDFDGDEIFSAGEQVFSGEPIRSGIRVFEFEVPAKATATSVPRTRVQVSGSEPPWRSASPGLEAGQEAQAEKLLPPARWSSDFYVDQITEEVEAFAVFDDGSGEALYVGGHFLNVGASVTVNRIAKWDGKEWSALSGPAGTGTDGVVRALTVYDDGSGPALYVGGHFLTAGGVTVNNIARWDGSAWSALTGVHGTGTDPEVFALAVSQPFGVPLLYVGGRFLSAGGISANHIAEWNGTTWRSLGVGTSSWVTNLAVFDDGDGVALYASGHFITADGVTVNRIAKWARGRWSALSGPSGIGVSSSISDMAVYDDGGGEALYVGGGFSTAGGVRVNHVARWDGTAWSALAGAAVGTDKAVSTLGVFDDGSGQALYAGGPFTLAGGVAAERIAKWDGSGWSTLSGPAGSGLDTPPTVLGVYDDGAGDKLLVGGDFEAAGGVAAQGVAKWDGSAWSALSEPTGHGLSSTVYAMEVFDDGRGDALYVAGDFLNAGGIFVNRIAKWNGQSWMALAGPSGVGADQEVRALTVFDDGQGKALYAGGSFNTMGGVAASRIAKWDGSTWSALAGTYDVDGTIYAMTVYDDGDGEALYAGGSFTTIGMGTFGRLGRWDGSAWSTVYSNPNDEIYALAVYDDGSGEALYAGGRFTEIGGRRADRVARWDGSRWSDLYGTSGGPNRDVKALAVYDDGHGEALYAGGHFFFVGGRSANHVARWDGERWSILHAPEDIGTNGWVEDLAVYDDGHGAALYVGGRFSKAGGMTALRIAKWDGITWSVLSGPSGNGTDQTIYSLAAFGSALYAGGAFRSAGGVASRFIGRYSRESDLSVAQTDRVTSATPGGSLTYTLVAANAIGPDDDPAATLTDTFPTELECSYTSVAAGGASGNTVSGSGDLQETLALPVGSSVTYTVVCAIDPGAVGILSNTVVIQSSNIDPEPVNNSATDDDTVLLPEADLVMEKTDGQVAAVPGQALSYILTARNSGPSHVVDAAIEDILPAELVTCTWTCITSGGASCRATPPAGDLDEDVALPVGATVSFVGDCLVAPTASGTLFNEASIHAAGVRDPFPANNIDIDIDVLQPVSIADLEITVDNGVTRIGPGDTLFYTVTATNLGPDDAAATDVEDLFPSVLIDCAWICEGLGSSTCTAGPISGALRDRPYLSAGTSAIYMARCQVDPKTMLFSQLSNFATLAPGAGVFDPDLSNNTASDTDDGPLVFSDDFEAGDIAWSEWVD